MQKDEKTNGALEKVRDKDIYGDNQLDKDPSIELTADIEQYSQLLINGDIQNKIHAYLFFIDHNIIPPIDDIYDLAVSHLSLDDALLMGQVFIFLAHFFRSQGFELLSRLLHDPRNDVDYFMTIIGVLKEHADIIFHDSADVDDKDKENRFNLLRLIVSRVAKICMSHMRCVEQGTALLVELFDVYKGNQEW